MKTIIYDLLDASAYAGAIGKAGEVIRKGGLVVFPTETVYGLGADALNPSAVEKIFAAKSRPPDNPVIVHVSDVSGIERVARVASPQAQKLIDAFMPGPITILLPKKENIPDCVTAGRENVGIRIPSLKSARDFIKAAGRPIAAPSANISGKPSPTLPHHAVEDMDGRVDMILTEGACGVGVESTVVEIAGNRARILRPGGISAEQIAAYLEVEAFYGNGDDGSPRAPGMKYAHYKPNAKVVCIDGQIGEAAEWINKALRVSDHNCVVAVFENAFDKIDRSLCRKIFSLGSKLCPQEAARELFACLRSCDELGANTLYIMNTAVRGLGAAYRNRVYKAADEIVNLGESD